ncbi:MAG: molybdopterin-dependent oxidoreductase [Candidatus Thermoplasmatota archaeon]|nr:molybdopterin-dependent oxidoreductase [Candidatus Thermoplasmatota archaeon]
MNKIIKLKFILLFIVIVSSLFFSGCIQGPIELDGVEIREYQGEDLSSVQDFRENSIKGPQEIDEDDYQLKITGLVEKPKSYSYTEVLNRFQSYKKVVRLNCVEGWSVDILWEGVLIEDILNEVEPTADAKIIIFHAEDGYTTSLSIDYIIENNLLMAYKMNNVTLPVERGFPFQLVAESKWGYKWIKWITEIELSSDESYEGYWEQRGYSNSANINESFIG